MKKILVSLLLTMGVIVACSDNSNKVQQDDVVEQNQTSSPEYEKIVFSYKIDDLKTECDVDSSMICAIDLAVKCTLNPKLAQCDKNLMPSFIFMEDESLQRPTDMSFRVYKLKPLNGGLVEAYTESSCNGGWFGLCQGNVIYVLAPQGEGWKVNDIYSLAQ